MGEQIKSKNTQVLSLPVDQQLKVTYLNTK